MLHTACGTLFTVKVQYYNAPMSGFIVVDENEKEYIMVCDL